ncbi:MAG: HDOD domain-containing protein [Proteobacteria bacterium]|nr:HDOD domain-containing protein [Pseudomonadota bacterium]
MGQHALMTKEFFFDKTIFVRFPGRKDFTLARYISLSLGGFSCAIPKQLSKGEIVQVDVNLKMITDGIIDDRDLHLAHAKFEETQLIEGKQVHRFTFISFKGPCMERLVKALRFLEEKEKVIAMPALLPQSFKNGKIPELKDLVLHIMENVKTGRVVLPVLPRVVRDVEALVSDPDSSIEDLAMVIEQDASISIKILATANSLFYRGTTHLVSIRETLPRLGLKETRNLVLTIANKSLYSAKSRTFKIILDKLWSHSLCCAHLARAMARELACPDTENYYLSGLVHDIGKTLIYRYLSQMLPEPPAHTPLDIIQCVEESCFEMTEIILRHWEFSKEFIRTVNIKAPLQSQAGKSLPTQIVHTANLLSRNMGYDIHDGAVDLSNQRSVKTIGLSLESLGQIAEQVQGMMDGSGHIF